MKYALEVTNLIKQLDTFQLGNINMVLEPGYIMGLIGPNGAGKTTLLQTILGLYRPTEGSVKICGYDNVEQEAAAKAQIGFILDDDLFLEHLSVMDNAHIYGRYYPTWNWKLFEQYGKQFELNLKKPLKKLSKGGRMKFQLAFALSHNAKLLVFDEPTSGLDPVFRKDLLGIMCDIISEGERSILYSTHLTNELDQVADYITFLQNGKQIFSLSYEEVMERYALMKGSADQIGNLEDAAVVGKRMTEVAAEALIRRDLTPVPQGLLLQKPTLEDILYYSIQG